MKELVDVKFSESCFTLSTKDILEFDKTDNGPINNVISRINEHCYGVNLYDGNPIFVEMYYVNNNQNLKGDLIRLDIHDIDYFHLLLRFSILLSNSYENVDAVDAFNTFQIKLRGFLEKLGFFTITDSEILPYKDKNLIMMSKSPVYHVRTINKTEFYRMFFNNNFDTVDIENSEYVYLMVNEDTSFVKIGTSKKPKYREKTLHSQEPKINLIAKWKCDKKIEKQLHQIYRHKKVRGEWFNLTINDLKEIEDYMSIITND